MAALGTSTNTHLANDMTLLLNKIERRAGLTLLLEHLPKHLNKEAWAKVIEEDTLVTFSRYFPNKIDLQITSETCDKKRDASNVMWYYIKDEVTNGVPILGILDINWKDTSARNSGLSTGVGSGYYAYDMPCIEGTLESIIGLQMNADFASLYNRQIWVDFQYPNRFALRGLGNISYDLNTFIITVLLQNVSLSTIPPSMGNVLENLAMCDVCNFLYMNLRYFDGLETAYINIDLKLQELQDIANRREQIIDELNNSYVSAANSNIPYIWSV